MAKLIRNIRTTAGKKLINSAISGENKLIYTTAELYVRDVGGLTDTQLADTEALGTPLLSGKISVTDYNDTTITASAEFLNSNLTNDIAFRTIGWYATTAIDKAQGKPPVLFVISQLDNETTLVAGNNSRTTSFFIPRIIMRISDTQKVVLETGEVGFVTFPELEEKIADLANKGLIDFGQKFNNGFNLNDLHNTSLHYVDKGSVIGLPDNLSDDPKDLGGYLISLGKGNTTQDGVRIYFSPFSKKTYISYYLNKTNTWTDWIEVGSQSYTKGDIDKILENYATNKSLTDALMGKADVVSLSKYVQKVEDFKPDKETGNVSFLIDTYKDQTIEPNTLNKIGIYKLVNCTYKSVKITGIDEKDVLNGYLVVTKGKTDNDLLQYLITDFGDKVKINFRKINQLSSIYPQFNKLLDENDVKVHSFENADYSYKSGEYFDVDQAKKPGIYYFYDAKVVSTLRKDALDGLPRTTDGTTMFGYMVVLVHDNWNIDQILLLNSGMEPPDFVIATRSISGVTFFRPRFRKILNFDDTSLDIQEHEFKRSRVFDPEADENSRTPLMPTDITSTTPLSVRINLDNMINVYKEGSRVIDDFVSSSIPKFYISCFKYEYVDNGKTISMVEGLFHNHIQRIQYLVKPLLVNNTYDTYQRVKSGGCVFERYHKKAYSETDDKKGWQNWNFIENYGTGLGDRSVFGLLNEGIDSGSSIYDTVGVDYPPVMPNFAPMHYFNGTYNEDNEDLWLPPAIYVRRIGYNFSANVDFPAGNTINSGDTILEVKSVPFIFGGLPLSNTIRATSHFIQKVYNLSPSTMGTETDSSSDLIYERQGYLAIPFGTDNNRFSTYKQVTGKWYQIRKDIV